MPAPDLQTYLQDTGMTFQATTAIAAAYADQVMLPGGLREWLTAHGYHADAVMLLVKDWEARNQTAEQTPVSELIETVTLRSRCLYEVAAPDQLTGRCYCVAVIPATFPGPMEPLAADGQPPQPLAILAAEADHGTGQFRWVTLSPHAKLMFGAALERGRIATGKWAWVREYDLTRGERPPGYTGR